jgi:Tfp pilus assembly protein FimT
MTEMLTVVALLGIASAVAIPQFNGNITQYAQSAARAVSQDIQYAQDLAVTTQSSVTMTFTDSGYEYSLKDSSGSILTHPVDHKPYTFSFKNDPGMSRLTVACSFAGATEIVFDAFGTPSAGGTITLSHSTLPSDVVVTLHPATGSVTVSGP